MPSSSASTSSSVEGKMIRLATFDGQEFVVAESVAVQSQTIRCMIEDECADGVILVPNVKGSVLSKVLAFCRKHVESSSDEDLKTWDKEFVKVDQATLFDLILAAGYLNIRDLMDLTCQTAADVIKNMSVDNVRKIFDIDNDFTPERRERGSK